jgi:hypothetical protein
VPIYDRLVEFERGTTNIVPGLAESWTAAPDGLSYTFKLRRGVKFHSNAHFTPSRDFNADDVLFSYNRMADPNHPYAKVTPGQTYAYFEDMGMKDIVDHVEKLDAMSVKFVLKKPEAPFMADMAMDFASILSAEYADRMMAAKTPEIVDKEPIGTGPFQFVSYQKDAVIRYKAFDAHWSGRPKIDNLVFAITTDASVRYAKLKTGECQVMAFPKPPGTQPGDEQEGDPRQRLPGCRPGGQEPDPAHALVVQRQGAGLSVRPGEGEGAAGPGRLPARLPPDAAYAEQPLPQRCRDGAGRRPDVDPHRRANDRGGGPLGGLCGQGQPPGVLGRADRLGQHLG